MEGRDKKGSAALRDLIRLYCDGRDTRPEKTVAGLLAVNSRPVLRRISDQGRVAFVRGLEVTLEFDEAAFEGTGVFLLGAVMNIFFVQICIDQLIYGNGDQDPGPWRNYAMAGKSRNQTYALKLTCLENPVGLSFFQTVRRVECLFPDLPRFGHALRSSDEPVQFCQAPSLIFSPATLQGYVPPGDNSKPRLMVNLWDAGPGPMPCISPIMFTTGNTITTIRHWPVFWIFSTTA